MSLPRLHRLLPRFANDLVVYGPIVLMVVAIIYRLARVWFRNRFKSLARAL